MDSFDKSMLIIMLVTMLHFAVFAIFLIVLLIWQDSIGFWETLSLMALGTIGTACSMLLFSLAHNEA